jgi:hypothetical protein
MGPFLFNIVNFCPYFIYLYLLCPVSLWYLFKASMSSFICFCVFSYSLFLLSWNFLSASYTFCLTMSSIIAMKFSVISCSISSFRICCEFHWVPWDSLSLFCWSLELIFHFLHFPLNPVLIYFFGEGRTISIPFSSSHPSNWCGFCPWSMCNLVIANLQ